MDIEYYNRQSRKLETERVLGEKWIRWAYQDRRAGIIQGILFRSRLLSTLTGLWYDSSLSRGKIEATISELEIDPSEFAEDVSSYRSFNEFFIRHLKEDSRPFDRSTDDLSSPADGRLLVFPELEQASVIPVKGCSFTVDKLLGRDGTEYHGGALAIVRLCPADYHRYHFPCSGSVIETNDINGAYHSVNPIALATNIDVFGENKRSYTVIDNPSFGRVCFMEVGAFGVGSIIQTYDGTCVEKMQEKGYFKFGGSTVVLIFEPNRIKFAEDLIRHSREGIETLVRCGESIGKAVKVTG